MVFTTDTLARASFKKLQGLSHSEASKDPANESEASQITIAAQEIFGEILPTDPDVAVVDGYAAFVTLGLTIDASSNGKSYQASIATVAGTGLSGKTNPRTGTVYQDADRVGYLIPPQFGTQYRGVVYNNGTEVPPLSAEDWFLDYRSGIVTSENDLGLVNGTLDGYVYVGDFVSDKLVDLLLWSSIGSDITNSNAGEVLIANGISAPSTGVNSEAYGAGATAADNAVSIGSNSVAAANSIAIGRTVIAGANEFVAGDSNMNITDVYFGEGSLDATPAEYTIHGTGGTGIDIVGGDLNLAGGRSTGAGLGGSLVLQTSPASVSGSGVNLLVDRVTVGTTGLLTASFGISAPSSGTSSEAYGSGATATISDSIALGNGAGATAARALAVGRGASATGDNATAIGAFSSAGVSGIAIGRAANAAANSIAIGQSTASANEFVAGNATVPINNVYFGDGVTDATPTAYTINGSGGLGTDITGGNITVAGGRGTGSGAGGSIIFQTADGGTTGAALNALATAMTILDNGNVGIGETTPATDLHLTGTTARKIRIDLNDTSVANDQDYGILEWHGNNAVSGVKVYSEIKTAANASLGTIGQTDMAFSISTTSGLTEIMRLESTGRINLKNVVGTTLRFDLDDTTVSDGQAYGIIEWFGNDASTSASGIRARINGLASPVDGSLGATDISFETTAAGSTTLSEVMRLSKDGYVGIGTSDPAAMLHLSSLASTYVSTIRLEDTDTTTVAEQALGRIEFATQDTSNVGVAAKIEARATGTAANSEINFHAGSATTLRHIMKVGAESVAIAHNNTLPVVSASVPLTIGTDAGNGSRGYIVLNNNTIPAFGEQGVLSMKQHDGGQHYLWVDNSGSPGVLRIHTALPDSSSDIAGTVVGTQTFTGFHFYPTNAVVDNDNDDGYDGYLAIGDAVRLVDGYVARSSAAEQGDVIGLFTGMTSNYNNSLTNECNIPDTYWEEELGSDGYYYGPDASKNGILYSAGTPLSLAGVASLGDARDFSITSGLDGFSVCDEGGPIVSGDLLCSSSIYGYLMKQSDDLLHSYTAGKALESVSFGVSGKAVGVYGYLYCG